MFNYVQYIFSLFELKGGLIFEPCFPINGDKRKPVHPIIILIRNRHRESNLFKNGINKFFLISLTIVYQI